MFTFSKDNILLFSVTIEKINYIYKRLHLYIRKFIYWFYLKVDSQFEHINFEESWNFKLQNN